MTLSRQLMLSGLILLLCLFTGMITFVVRNTQLFLNHELASHSQDTATALGLTLTTTIKINDMVTAGRMVDAVWDRGYYRSIIIEGADGKPLIDREQRVAMYGVPQWFINFLKLNTQPKEALIMEGWRKVGKVKIEGNPGFAYQQIWMTFIDSLEWFLITALIAMLMGWMLLYFILRPLRAITAQAMAICHQQFPIQENLPLTIDLKLVVEAMNNMSRRLKKMFEEQSQASEHLREQAYKDPVTKLGNRRYFDLQFEFLLKDREKGAAGALLLIEVTSFKEYNDKYGYAAGDKLLQNIAATLIECCKPFDNAIVSHLKGATLSIILPNKTKEIATEVASDICQKFSEFKSKGLSQDQDVGVVGIASFRPADAKKDILSHADMALRQAQTQGQNVWHSLDNVHPQHVHGAQEWGEIFAEVIRENKILLYYQEVDFFKDQSYKIYETLLRLRLNEQEIISAGVFMPMAERLNMMTALDRLVIENVVARILKSNENHIFSVNLSPSSLEDESFKTWLLEKLRSLAKKAQQLVIEVPEYGVINRLEEVREFFLKFSKLGGLTTIDHYGKNFNSFSYLYNLRLNYLKIDGGFIREIESSEENQFFIRSLIDIAHSLDIQIVAEAVESEAEYNALKGLKVDGVQGYFVAKPGELKE